LRVQQLCSAIPRYRSGQQANSDRL
jgi:hypothetical protein